MHSRYYASKTPAAIGRKRNGTPPRWAGAFSIALSFLLSCEGNTNDGSFPIVETQRVSLDVSGNEANGPSILDLGSNIR